MPDEVLKSINVELIDYIDRVVHKIQCSIDGKCEVWQMGLGALRKEWELEHRNLINRYESSEREKAVAKIEVDRHFETINGLQARMDKLSESFVTKKEFDKQFSSMKAWLNGCLISLILLLIAVIVDLMRHS